MSNIFNAKSNKYQKQKQPFLLFPISKWYLTFEFKNPQNQPRDKNEW